jgi:hypothetical protein
MALKLAGEGYAEGGVTEFLGLSDTPGSYSEQAGKYAKVNAVENALEFDAPSGAGDMLKSVYDTDEDGVVDNSEKLEGSTKAEVQDHDPKAHAASHQNAGADEISVAGLSGELADAQPPKTHNLGGSEHGAETLANLNAKISDATLDDSSQPRDPNAHASSHQNGGGDEISVAGLSGELADLQKPKDHTHQSSGSGVGGKLDHGLALDGLGDDDHSQYLNTTRHDTPDRHGLGTVVPHDALANLTEKAHASLTGVTSDQHHNEDHASRHKSGGGDILYVPRTYVWFISGNVATGTEQGPTFRLKRVTTVEDVELHVKTAPTGASLIVDINEGGAALFSTRPEIDAGATTEDDNHVFSDTELAAGAELTLDVDQVGSGTPGADLTVLLHCKEALI